MNELTDITIIDAPISKRYWCLNKPAQLDLDNKQVRTGGCWFDIDERWTIGISTNLTLKDVNPQHCVFKMTEVT